MPYNEWPLSTYLSDRFGSRVCENTSITLPALCKDLAKAGDIDIATCQVDDDIVVERELHNSDLLPTAF